MIKKSMKEEASLETSSSERLDYHKNRQKTPYEIFDSIGDECRHFLKDFRI